MRPVIPVELEACRVRDGLMGSNSSYGLAGMFQLPGLPILLVISSGPGDGSGWEHVSVSAQNRTPSWTDMSMVKALFWCDDECVVQYHPPRADHINIHQHCLHLWKPVGEFLPMPPKGLIA